MKATYQDIRNKVAAEPTWFDGNGVPRYCEFGPEHLPSIYAKEAVLLHIRCQACGESFAVGLGGSPFFGTAFSELVQDWQRHEHDPHRWGPIHYGDPPIHGCVGDTMSSIDVEIVQFWQRGGAHEWARVPEFEIALEDE